MVAYVAPSSKPGARVSIQASLATAESKEIDDAIAELFYGDDLNHALANSPRWKKVIGLLKRAPPAYKPPDRNRLGPTCSRARRGGCRPRTPKRLADLIEYGGTIVSDGWDDVERNRLINLLLVAAAASTSTAPSSWGADHEDAEKVASIIKGEIKRVGVGVGPTKVVQVCTDTCSVMQKAWSLIRAEYPWITTTCCGPHVLSLLLKDIGEKIPEVAAIIANCQKILNRFWGRKRWARTKLKEVIEKNHKKRFGLYRAKVTRFAGKATEMQRILRCKYDLKEVVASKEYAEQKFATKNDDDETGDGVDHVEKLINDEDGFWAPMVQVLKGLGAAARGISVPREAPRIPETAPNLLSPDLRPLAAAAHRRRLFSLRRRPRQIMTPIKVMLRLTDGSKPVMGKIYDRMYSLRRRSRKAARGRTREGVLRQALGVLPRRCTPPATRSTRSTSSPRAIWTCTNKGLQTVVERLCLADCIDLEKNEATKKELSIDSDTVQERVAACMIQFAEFRKKEDPFAEST